MIKTILVICVIISSLIISIIHTGTTTEESVKVKQDSSKEKFIFDKEPSELVKKKLSEMPLREKIAQMVISNTIPAEYDESSSSFNKLKKLCTEDKVGGFIFFKGESWQYAKLSNKLQEMSDVPLLISADFERGTAMRVNDGTLFPNNMAIGAANNPDLAYQMGLLIAKETRLLGVHQNYAPVCDVNNNPNNPIINVRSFGEDPTLVSKMSQSLFKGLQDGKVIATVKHFPGHGDTEIDSHNDLPVLNFDMDRMNSIELVPFKNAVNNNVMSVMIAHLSFPQLDATPHLPSSLSSSIVNDLLQKQIGFKGLVVTDALNMKGITKYFSVELVAVLCVKAGIDLILMSLDERKTIDAIEKAVNNGNITEDRINTSAEKILKAKEWLGLFENKFVNDADVHKTLPKTEGEVLAQKIADESITLVKDEYNLLPIKDKSSKVMLVTLSDAGDYQSRNNLAQSLTAKFPNTTSVDYSGEIPASYLPTLVDMCNKYDYIIVGVYAKVRFGTGKISMLQSHIDLIKELAKTNKNFIVVAYGNPYLLKKFSWIPGYICAYGDSPVSIDASVKAITGEIKFKGKLPVGITNEFKFGHGIIK